ncbi:MAG TPA: hypothetical protein VH589_10145 [Trebonia sp.]
MSAGTAKASRLASPGPAEAQSPGRPSTATAAVGNADGGSGGGDVSPTVNSARPGLCPTISAVSQPSGNSRTSISSPSTVAS